MSSPLIIVTRGSPLALQQAKDAAQHLEKSLQVKTEIKILTTTGDRQAAWSLEKQGGKGLFTAELEQALQRGEADVAIHSAKDLPTEMPAGLTIASCLPRRDPRDVLVRQTQIQSPQKIATGSPRRRAQGAHIFPHATWTELRGNVDTRLKKIVQGEAEATYLAAAGLSRLGIEKWDGLVFEPVDITKMVPAAGQGAHGGGQDQDRWVDAYSGCRVQQTGSAAAAGLLQHGPGAGSRRWCYGVCGWGSRGIERQTRRSGLRAGESVRQGAGSGIG